MGCGKKEGKPEYPGGKDNAGRDGEKRRVSRKKGILWPKKYNADEIGQRILNEDGGNWIKEPYDPDNIFQLDRYHICQEILRKISHKEAQKEIRRLFDEENQRKCLRILKPMQSVWKVRTKRRSEAKRQENCISIYIITGRGWCSRFR